MKRLVLFGIVIFLVIIGGFLIVDKVWLHKVFKITPGKCLILDNKNCKLLKLTDVYYGKIISGTVEGTKVFVPINGSCNDKVSVFDFVSNQMKNVIWIESNQNGKTYRYQFLFDKGSVRCKSTTIKKGEVLTEIEKNNKTTITLQITSWKTDDQDEKENGGVLEEDLENKLLTK